MKKNQFTEKQDLQRHLSFYLHEQRKWNRTFGRRLTLTFSLVFLTLLAASKEKPMTTMAGTCASLLGIKSLMHANFYRRRSAYRVRQQRKSLERN